MNLDFINGKTFIGGILLQWLLIFQVIQDYSIVKISAQSVRKKKIWSLKALKFYCTLMYIILLSPLFSDFDSNKFQSSSGNIFCTAKGKQVATAFGS